MENHYCQYLECEAIARFVLFKRWYCAEHYDALMIAEAERSRDSYEAGIQSKRG
jgi:hypothetical protein